MPVQVNTNKDFLLLFIAKGAHHKRCSAPGFFPLFGIHTLDIFLHQHIESSFIFFFFCQLIIPLYGLYCNLKSRLLLIDIGLLPVFCYYKQYSVSYIVYTSFLHVYNCILDRCPSDRSKAACICALIDVVRSPRKETYFKIDVS